MEGILKDNQYPFGGLFPVNIPAVLSGVGKKLRDRMYRTVRPESYSREQLDNFIMGKSREAYRDPNSEALFGKYTGQDSIIADYTQAPEGLPIGRILTQAEIDSLGANNNTLAKYAVNDIIVPSKSKQGAFEFAYPNQSGNAPHLPYNYNDIPSSRWTHSKQLGSYEQSKGKEGNRYSITYKDVWDINPFRGKSYNDDPTWQSFIEAGKSVGLDKLGDIVPFGKPFDIHGKQYYDGNGKPVKSKSEGGFIYKPRDAWDNLSMLEKSEMMKVAVRNGITDLKTIREQYNEFAKGGYLDWKEKASKYKHLDIDNDRTYDYEGWYNENPQRAWDFLNNSPDAHFDDKYKTVYHPTFSTQSKYSGKKDATYNPLGLIGGTWDKQGTIFTMSPDGYRGPVSMDERKWYLENAEDNGVQLREVDGSLPIYDGIPWGGVFPNVTVIGNRFTKGGGIHIKPSHRGRLTELKKRTGKTEAELYKTGSPAVRKMITFARSARKWKHGLGGNLFDWTHGVSIEPANINLKNNFDFLNKTLTRKSKR